MSSRLHKECVMVKSWHYNVVLDLPRQRMFRYPESEELSAGNKPDQFNHFKENELFFPDEVNDEQFLDISRSHTIPTLLTTLIWEFSETHLDRVICLTKELNIQFLSVIFNGKISEQELEDALRAFEGTPLRSMDLFFLYNNDFTIDYFRDLRHINNRVVAVMSESNLSKARAFDDKKGVIALGKLDLTSPTTYFNIHIKQYIESLTYNPYFNNRLFIGSTGDIKIDRNARRVLGNIMDISNLEQWLDGNTYVKSVWESTKEHTDVCMNCEFRNICLDNRIPLQRSNGSYYHLTECDYNPYLAKWKGEDGYLPLCESGVTSDEQEFRIDTGKLAQINQALWA